ncbi:hypothetical protein Bca4012_037550 [Brassica carinata]
MGKLAKVDASDAGKFVGGSLDDQQASEVPPIITALVGSTYTFQLKLNEYNFSPKHQTFTISKVFTDRREAPNHVFDGEGGDGGDDGSSTKSKGVTSPASTSAEVGNNNANETSPLAVPALDELPRVHDGTTKNAKLKISESAAKKARTD